jgi:hypothetical protein
MEIGEIHASKGYLGFLCFPFPESRFTDSVLSCTATAKAKELI